MTEETFNRRGAFVMPSAEQLREIDRELRMLALLQKRQEVEWKKLREMYKKSTKSIWYRLIRGRNNGRRTER